MLEEPQDIPATITTFEEVIDRFAAPVYSQVRHLLRTNEDIEDATQDVLMAVYHSLSRFKGQASLITWVYRITYLTCKKYRRRQMRTHRLFAGEWYETATADLDPGPESDFMKREQTGILMECLAELPSRDAALLSLFYFEEKSYEEIAAALQMSSSAVGVVLHRARQRLKQMLASRGFVPVRTELFR